MRGEIEQSAFGYRREEMDSQGNDEWGKGTKECYHLQFNWTGHKPESPAVGEFIKFVRGRIKLHKLGTDHRCCHVYLCMN